VDQRDSERGAMTVLERPLPARGVFIPFGEYVCDVDRSPVDYGTRSHGLTLKRYSELSDRTDRGNLPMVRNEAQTVAKHLKNCRVICIAQARRGLDQRIEYFLHVERRTADDLQNIGCGRLLFQAFC